jgi:GTP cyclohydrolase II
MTGHVQGIRCKCGAVEMTTETSEAYDSPARPDPLAAPPMMAVMRAVADLRRGLGVVVSAPGTADLVALAAEMLTDARLAALRGYAVPDLVLTHHRATTLKIRLYTPSLVRVPVPARTDAALIRSLADPAEDLSHPLRGPFEARRDAVPPTVAAALRLAKIARLLPAVLTIDAAPGMAALSRIAAADVDGFDVAAASTLVRVSAARVPLAGAEDAHILAYRPRDGGTEHLAIVIGDIGSGDGRAPVLARIHSECFTGDLLGSLKCDCGQQLRGAITEIAAAGAGVLLYLAQEGRGIGLINKLRAYALQDQGFDTVEANQRLGFEADERLFLPAAQMLRELGLTRVRLMTNNPDKVAALESYGIDVAERVPHAFPSNEHNAFYLSTKAKKSGHLL